MTDENKAKIREALKAFDTLSNEALALLDAEDEGSPEYCKHAPSGQLGHFDDERTWWPQMSKDILDAEDKPSPEPAPAEQGEEPVNPYRKDMGCALHHSYELADAWDKGYAARPQPKEPQAEASGELLQWDEILSQPIEGLLYDIDLLPEQIKSDVERMAMRVITEMHERLAARPAPTDTDISHAILNDDMRGVDHAQLRRLFATFEHMKDQALESATDPGIKQSLIPAATEARELDDILDDLWETILPAGWDRLDFDHIVKLTIGEWLESRLASARASILFTIFVSLLVAALLPRGLS